MTGHKQFPLPYQTNKKPNKPPKKTNNRKPTTKPQPKQTTTTKQQEKKKRKRKCSGSPTVHVYIYKVLLYVANKFLWFDLRYCLCSRYHDIQKDRWEVIKINMTFFSAELGRQRRFLLSKKLAAQPPFSVVFCINP